MDDAVLPRQTATPDAVSRWLAIIGIGEDGVEGLSPAARRLVEGAEIVYGGARHLSLVAPLVTGEARPWPTPFSDAVRDVARLRGRRVCLVVSGDPFWYGAGATMMAAVDPAETVVIPAPSAFSLAAARLGWALQDTVCISVHGRPLDVLGAHLVPGARILALAWDERTPAAAATYLRDRGFGAAELTILERLGGPHERVRSARAADFAFTDVHALNTVAISIGATGKERQIPFSSGLDDEWFESDGQLTKREVRALVLSSLAPQLGEHLWDVGAGSGSIGIEWLLRHPTLQATAFEVRDDRVQRIARNASVLGTPRLDIVHGSVPETLAGARRPDAIFLGGGVGTAGVIDMAFAVLPAGGRLVANAVTLEAEAALLAARARHGGELVRLQIARADPVGGLTGWRPAMPITHWRLVKR